MKTKHIFIVAVLLLATLTLFTRAQAEGSALYPTRTPRPIHSTVTQRPSNTPGPHATAVPYYPATKTEAAWRKDQNSAIRIYLPAVLR